MTGKLTFDWWSFVAVYTGDVVSSSSVGSSSVTSHASHVTTEVPQPSANGQSAISNLLCNQDHAVMPLSSQSGSTMQGGVGRGFMWLSSLVRWSVSHWRSSMSRSWTNLKLEGHSVERMYLRQRCFDGSLPQWMKPLQNHASLQRWAVKPF